MYKDIKESIQVLQKELISGRIKLGKDGRIPPAGVLILRDGNGSSAT
jgi:hypothetical protein